MYMNGWIFAKLQHKRSEMNVLPVSTFQTVDFPCPYYLHFQLSPGINVYIYEKSFSKQFYNLVLATLCSLLYVSVIKSNFFTMCDSCSRLRTISSQSFASVYLGLHGLFIRSRPIPFLFSSWLTSLCPCYLWSHIPK